MTSCSTVLAKMMDTIGFGVYDTIYGNEFGSISSNSAKLNWNAGSFSENTYPRSTDIYIKGRAGIVCYNHKTARDPQLIYFKNVPNVIANDVTGVMRTYVFYPINFAVTCAVTAVAAYCLTQKL
jgi:hypothetical protein